MDEYYCPNCGAILNDQLGFNPDCGAWTCTECGMMLMDDDVYHGDTYEGVAWYCDKCGALLNRQHGFSDSYGSWTCTECGYQNGTTEDDINGPGQFSCPSCGVSLDYQPGFNKYDDDWECTACGAHLCHRYSDADYEVIRHMCPRCNAPLDIQFCFSELDSDWTCAECGANLRRKLFSDDFEEIIDTEQDADAQDDTDDNEDEDDEDIDDADEEVVNDDINNSAEYNSHINNGTPKFTSNTRASSRTYSLQAKKVNWKLRILEVLFLIVAIIIAGIIYEVRIRIPVGYSSTDMIGLNYEEVVSGLSDTGFTNISTNEIADLSIDDIGNENLVTNVQIGSDESFDSDSKYPSNFPVKVTYRTLVKLYVPITSKEAKGENYQEVMSNIEDAGFANISLEIQYDIITGWLTKDGEVESVTVNGDKKYSSGVKYRADAEIVITYHTLRKNRPKR